jgi:hypothetical protein
MAEKEGKEKISVVEKKQRCFGPLPYIYYQSEKKSLPVFNPTGFFRFYFRHF